MGKKWSCDYGCVEVRLFFLLRGSCGFVFFEKYVGLVGCFFLCGGKGVY